MTIEEFTFLLKILFIVLIVAGIMTVIDLAIIVVNVFKKRKK